MSKELKPAAVHDANVFLPGSLGPVRREVVLAYEHDRVVDQLRAELATLKVGQGEAVAYIRTTDIDRLCQAHVAGCAASLSKAPGEGWIAIYTAPPASADAVAVPVELLELCFEGFDDYWVASPEGIECTSELRAALAELKAGHGEAVAWRDHSVNYAKGEKCPATIETLQAAWDRDQELMLDQKNEISELKETINQLRQKRSASADAVSVPIDFVRFLLGETDLNGYSFGELHQVRVGKFWWRTELRALLAQSQEVKP